MESAPVTQDGVAGAKLFIDGILGFLFGVDLDKNAKFTVRNIKKEDECRRIWNYICIFAT